MAKLITVSWRDIPAQIIAQAGRERVKIKLPERFEQAIDRAAMRAGKGSSDAYLEDWKRNTVKCGADIQTEAEAAAQKIESEYDHDRLLALIRNKGNQPGGDQSSGDQ